MLITIVVSGAFAQEEDWDGAKNFLSADIGLLHIGLRYERLITPQISAGAVLYWNSFFILWNELETGVFGRYYYQNDLYGLYGELGLGYHRHTGDDTFLRSGIGISPGLGYKFDPGKTGDIYISPSLTIPITIGKQESNDLKGEFGISVGVVLYCSIGFAWK
jgi:hypothetical protein